MYEIYCKLRDSKGLSDYQVAKLTGINRSTFSDWKSGRSVPKNEKLQKLAEFFHVSLDYLRTGNSSEKESSSGKTYYFDDATAEAAQELFEDSDLRALMDAAKGVSPENIRLAAEMLRRFKEEAND